MEQRTAALCNGQYIGKENVNLGSVHGFGHAKNKHFKKLKDKMWFINELSEDDNLSVQEKIPMIRTLAVDKNPEVRMELARQLVLFDNIEIEDVLYVMLFDKNRMVRLEAVDSLAMGRQEKTIEKVASMIGTEGYLVRAYAVYTVFELIINCYGVNEEAFEKYEEIVSKYYPLETNPHVLIAYYQNYFFMNHEKGLCLLKNAYVDAVEKKDYRLLWSLLHIFQEILNFDTKAQIGEILKYKAEDLLSVQREFVTRIMTGRIVQKILVVDADNTYLSHIVSAKLNFMKICDTEIRTAGLDTGIVQKGEIIEFCKRQEIVSEKNYDSKRIMDVFSYEYIICLNMPMDERFALCKTFYYNDINSEDDMQVEVLCRDIEEKILRNKMVS